MAGGGQGPGSRGVGASWPGVGGARPSVWPGGFLALGERPALGSEDLGWGSEGRGTARAGVVWVGAAWKRMSPAMGAEGWDWRGVGRGRTKPEPRRVGDLERQSELGDSEMCFPNRGASGEERSKKERGAGGALLRPND